MYDQPEATFLYRYTGRTGRHHHSPNSGKPSVPVEKGEIIQLSKRQFEKFKDRFEPVESEEDEPVVQKSSTPPTSAVDKVVAREKVPATRAPNPMDDAIRELKGNG